MVDLDELEVPPNWLELLMYSWDFALQDENPALIPNLDCEWLNLEEIREQDVWDHGRLVHLNRLPVQPPEGVPEVQDGLMMRVMTMMFLCSSTKIPMEAMELPADDGININDVPPPAPPPPPPPE